MYKRQVQVVKDNLLSTGFSRQARVLNLSLEGFLRTDKTQFDLAYLDPPYRSDLLLTALEGVTLRMKEGGKILCEHPLGAEMPGQVGDFSLLRQYRYGKIQVSLYGRAAEE